MDTGGGMVQGWADMISDPAGTAQNMSLGMQQMLNEPEGTFSSIFEQREEGQINAALDNLRGDYFSSARTGMNTDLGFALDMGLLPVGRVGSLAVKKKVGELEVNQNHGEIPGGADNEIGISYGGYDPTTSSLNYNNLSTAKSNQSTAPRDLSEQILWNNVLNNPANGEVLPLGNDHRFPNSAGFQKMQVTHELPDGSNIVIHYQYNSVTDKAYDVKLDSPIPKSIQPGPTIKDDL